MDSDNQNKSLVDKFIEENRTEAAQFIDFGTAGGPKDRPPIPRHHVDHPIWLYIGILFFPWIFFWFTLKEKYPKKLRFVAFAWALLSLRISYSALFPLNITSNLLQGRGSTVYQRNLQPTEPQQTVQAPPPASQRIVIHEEPAATNQNLADSIEPALMTLISNCDFSSVNLPPDLTVFKVTANNGLQVTADPSVKNKEPINVIVNSKNPVALIAYAYDSTLWKIKWSENTKIAAIFATGYYPQ